MQTRQKLSGHAEGWILRCSGQHGNFTAFQQGQKEILLSFGKAMQFIQNQDIHPAELTSKLLKPSFRCADPQYLSSARFGKEEGKSGFTASWRSEQQKAGQAGSGKQ